MNRKYLDLTGKRFERLVAICTTNKRIGTSVVWECRCDCGKTVLVSSMCLRQRLVKSCGCLNLEKIHSIDLQKVKEQALKEKHFHENTYIPSLKRKINANNVTGVKGVSICGSKWRAVINFQGKKYSLGCYDTIEEAMTARKLAEEKLFHPIIEKYQSKHSKEVTESGGN